MSDFVRLRVDGKPNVNISWTQPWPPPEILHLVVLDNEMVGLAAYEIPGESKPLYQVTCSKLPDDLDSPHLARGALYVDDPETWDGRT